MTSGLSDSHLPAEIGKISEESGNFGDLRKRCADFMTNMAYPAVTCTPVGYPPTMNKPSRNTSLRSAADDQSKRPTQDPTPRKRKPSRHGPIRVERIETTPMTEDQYRRAVTALATLINEWQYNTTHGKTL